ncbi:sodium:proton antiporter [Thermostilla marina]
MSHSHDLHKTNRNIVVALGVVAVLYAVALALGIPQKGTALLVEAAKHEQAALHEGSADDADHATEDADGEHGTADTTSDEAAGHSEAAETHDESGEEHAGAVHEDVEGEHAGGGHGEAIEPPPLWMVTPFVILLLAIALLPLMKWSEHWWESNLHRFYVAAVLAFVTLIYFLVMHGNAIEAHWPAHHISEPSADLNWGLTFDVFANAIFNEYVPFIVLLFALYTISGGIRIEGDLRAHPLTNSIIILLGALLASFVGTTGAAMLLIWLLLDTNAERKHVQHTVIFFIFCVCNCGGCLLPIGDPPLFLGYLKGVPFLWTFQLWKEWLFVNGVLVVIYFLMDYLYFYRKEEKLDVLRDEVRTRKLTVRGLFPHLPLLIGVIFGVALLDPSQAFPGTNWHPPMYLREVVQLAMVALSLIWGDDELRKANQFNYHAIIEVAALFFGIFITMQPALQILNVEGPNLGLTSPVQFFWATGALSSFLDNAPTYVVFFETARSLGGENLVPPGNGVAEHLLVAISIGAVFMGANTYIGNAPNFMVRAIADKRGVKMPSFFGYMLWSGLILIPLFVVVTFVFLV